MSSRSREEYQSTLDGQFSQNTYASRAGTETLSDRFKFCLFSVIISGRSVSLVFINRNITLSVSLQSHYLQLDREWGVQLVQSDSDAVVLLSQV